MTVGKWSKNPVPTCSVCVPFHPTNTLQFMTQFSRYFYPHTALLNGLTGTLEVCVTGHLDVSQSIHAESQHYISQIDVS